MACRSLLWSTAFVAVVAVAVGQDEINDLGAYLNKFAHLDINTILSNDRLFTAYHNCFMEQGPCTGDAKAIKKALPIIRDTACSGCTVEQKKTLKNAFQYLEANRNAQWIQVLAKYDPDGIHVKDFLKATENL